MIRSVSIVLIVAVALHTVGCSTWRHVARGIKVSDDYRQSSLQDRILDKLKEGMRVRIRIRDGANAPVNGQVFVCVIDEVNATSLKVTPFKSPSQGRDERVYTIHYADITSIEEYRGYGRKSLVFVAGLTTGVILTFYCLVLAFRGE